VALVSEVEVDLALDGFVFGGSQGVFEALDWFELEELFFPLCLAVVECLIVDDFFVEQSVAFVVVLHRVEELVEAAAVVEDYQVFFLGLEFLPHQDGFFRVGVWGRGVFCVG